MFPISLCVLVCVSTLAFASSIPSSASRASQANIRCTALYATGQGDLRIFSPSVLPGDGVLLGITPVRDANENPILQSSIGDFQSFMFYACESATMNYNMTSVDGIDTYYGHIAVIDTPGAGNTQCLTAPIGQSHGQTVTAQNCSYTDDSSQLNQFWKIALNGQTHDPANVTFLGQANSTQGPSPGYATVFPFLGGNQVVEVLPFDDLIDGQPTYQVELFFNATSST